MGSGTWGNDLSYTSAAAIEQFVEVEMDTTDPAGKVVKTCTLNGISIGISQTSASAAGQVISVRKPGGTSRLKMTTTALAPGAKITSDANGKGIVVDAADEWCGAILESVRSGYAADETADVMITAFTAHA